jgi:hypothetical protein
MTDYVAPNGTKTNPRKPGTSEWAKAADERPLAMFEHAPGAPRMVRKILGASGATVTFTDLDEFGGFIADYSYADGTGGSPTSDVTISFSDDGTTFYDATVISDLAAGASGKIWVDFATGAWGQVVNQTYASGTFTGVSLDVVAVRFANARSGGAGACGVSFMPNGGLA